MFTAKPQNTDTIAWFGRFAYNVVGTGSEVAVAAIAAALSITVRVKTHRDQVLVRHEDKAAAYEALEAMGLAA